MRHASPFLTAKLTFCSTDLITFSVFYLGSLATLHVCILFSIQIDIFACKIELYFLLYTYFLKKRLAPGSLSMNIFVQELKS